LVLRSSLSVGCLTYKLPNTSTVFAFIVKQLSRFRAPLQQLRAIAHRGRGAHACRRRRGGARVHARTVGVAHAGRH
ncbi:hypothetical protein ABLN72_11970, partial [Mycobacterium tuberculosis]